MLQQSEEQFVAHLDRAIRASLEVREIHLKLSYARDLAFKSLYGAAYAQVMKRARDNKLDATRIVLDRIARVANDFDCEPTLVLDSCLEAFPDWRAARDAIQTAIRSRKLVAIVGAPGDFREALLGIATAAAVAHYRDPNEVRVLRTEESLDRMAGLNQLLPRVAQTPIPRLARIPYSASVDGTIQTLHRMDCKAAVFDGISHEAQTRAVSGLVAAVERAIVAVECTPFVARLARHLGLSRDEVLIVAAGADENPITASLASPRRGPLEVYSSPAAWAAVQYGRHRAAVAGADDSRAISCAARLIDDALGTALDRGYVERQLQDAFEKAKYSREQGDTLARRIVGKLPQRI